MIARSRSADERRRRRPDPVDPATIEPAAADPELDRLQERWRLAGYLERVPADEAEVLRMRFYEDLSQTEIADRSGTPSAP